MQHSRKQDNPRARADAIVNLLAQQDYVRVRDLAQHLNVSEATIRKDLSALEAQGLLRRTHGGAIHMRELTREIVQFYKTREISNLPEKQRIGQRAAQLIGKGETVALSGGSTPLQVAAHIPQSSEITIVTNDLSIVQVLSNHPHLEIFVPGGYLRLGRENLVGANAITALDGLDITTVFLTVTGLDLNAGATAGHIGNVVYLRELVARAEQCIVIADHTKFENPPQIVICSWAEVDALISDKGLAPTLQQKLEAKDVQVILT